MATAKKPSRGSKLLLLQAYLHFLILPSIFMCFPCSFMFGPLDIYMLPLRASCFLVPLSLLRVPITQPRSQPAMYFAILLSILPFFASTMCSKTPSKPASRQPLRLTAIAAANGKSILQCWQLDTPLGISSQPGTSGVAVQQLGDISNASYTVIPPSYDGGLHTAPRRQYVHFPFP